MRMLTAYQVSSPFSRKSNPDVSSPLLTASQTPHNLQHKYYFPAFLTAVNALPHCRKTSFPRECTLQACTQTPRKPKTVGIAGAGIAGLATALSLLKTPGTGVEHVSIFEPREELDSGLGGLLNINGGAAILANYYDLDLWKIGNQTNKVVARDSKGSILFQVDVQKQLDCIPASKHLLSKDSRHMFMSVMRDSLQQLLYDAVKSKAVSFHRGQDCKVMDVKQEQDKACFVLENAKKSHYFDLVIGADGIRSNVRCHVTGKVTPPEYSGIRVQWSIAPPGPCDLSANHLEQWFGDGGYVLRYAAGPKDALTEALALSFRDDERSTENVTYRTESNVKFDMETRLQACCMPKSVIDTFRKSTRFIETSVYYHKSIPSWSKGGVCTLAGDSAHAMPPFLGQGANQAIQDAHALALSLTKIGVEYTGLSDALEQYESIRNGPTSALMQSSRLIGLLETQRGLFGTSVRDSAFRLAGVTGAIGQTFVQSATPRTCL